MDTGFAGGTSREAASFLDALFSHYGPHLSFSAACVLNLQDAHGQARGPWRERVADTERALDAFFVSQAQPPGPYDALSHVGKLTVIPGSPARDGQGRRLWRVVRIAAHETEDRKIPDVRPHFSIPDGMGDESRHVIEHVNAEVARHQAGLRTESVVPLVQAAEERLRRYAREH